MEAVFVLAILNHDGTVASSTAVSIEISETAVAMEAELVG